MGIIKGSELLIKSLERNGVDLIFAYPGGQSIELHQALAKSPIRVILPRHEQGGAFAAGGYARASGRVGVAMSTSGPGATNLVSGIADAHMDSIPTVFITGQVASTVIGKNAFQEVDIIGMTRMIVKHSYLVLDAADIPYIVKEAFYLAASGRPGPVVIDVPKNVQQQLIDDFEATELKLPAYKPAGSVSALDAEKIKEMIRRSERPCVYAGGGVVSSGAADELVKFVENYNLPVVTTLMGIGAIPVKHPLNLRMLGMHGTYCANRAANECDLLISLGARFDDRVTGNPDNFARDAKIIHIDIDDSEINKNKRADLGLIADVKATLEVLNREPVRQNYAKWFADIANWIAQYPLQFERKENHLQPQFVISELSRLTNGEAVIVPGVGQHQMWAAQYYDYRFPRQLLTSGGLGAMGFGLPAAMGAKAACPDKLIVNIDGDGSFQMNIQELGTLLVEDLPIKMIILNNQHLGMVAQWEDRFYNGVRGNTVLGRSKGSCGIGQCDRSCNGNANCAGENYPDFVAIAKSYEIPGRTVRKPEELSDALREMLETPGSFLLDIYTGYEEHVLPMVPPGKDYKSIIM